MMFPCHDAKGEALDSSTVAGPWLLIIHHKKKVKAFGHSSYDPCLAGVCTRMASFCPAGAQDIGELLRPQWFLGFVDLGTCSSHSFSTK